MANQNQLLEFEEAITCPVCLSRYDESEKKPKYLVSCCHTLCRSCLKTISRSISHVVCPICRSSTNCSLGIDSLPTNSDKLYLLKLEKPLQNNEESLSWCFTCRKRTSAKCSTDNHSVVIMNSEILNSEIHLNMSSISARLKTWSKSILQNRILIGAKFDEINRWLVSYQEMIGRFRTSNSFRINQLQEMIEGNDLTISVQKLMQLSISKEQDLALLSDTMHEESAMKEIIKELSALEKTSETATKERYNSLLLLPSLPCIRKELDYARYFPLKQTSVDWPIILVESLANGNQSPFALIQNDESRFDVNERRPSFDLTVSPSIESQYFTSQSEASAQSPTIVGSAFSLHNNSFGGADIPIFRFGTTVTSGSLSRSGSREIISARRRRCLSRI